MSHYYSRQLHAALILLAVMAACGGGGDDETPVAVDADGCTRGVPPA